MDVLQKTFEAELKNQLLFPRVAMEVILGRLEGAGIELTPSQRVALEARLATFKETDFNLTLDLSDEQLAKSTLTDEERIAHAISLDFDSDKFAASIVQEIPSILRSCVDSTSVSMLRRLKSEAGGMLKDRGKQRRAFERRLAVKWGRAIDLLEALKEIALEAGEAYNTEFRPEAASAKDWVFEVLTRLHARSCQVASEIITLLRSGHADGAHARWRSLHEIAVVASFVAKHGNDVAERYILHSGIESARAVRSYQEHCERLGYEPLTDEEVSAIMRNRSVLIARYGGAYDENYGWASEALRNPRPNFTDIEADAGLAHLRPHYRLASHNVHANPKGVLFKLGLFPNAEMLLAGPSDLGLADPGHSAAISLAQMTMSLLTLKPNLDRLVVCEILTRLVDDVGAAFGAAHGALERVYGEGEPPDGPPAVT
jgi:hypothetical protein